MKRSKKETSKFRRHVFARSFLVLTQICQRFLNLFTSHTPYSKMAAILVLFCFHASWPL